LLFSIALCNPAEKKVIKTGKTYPRKDPMGVLTAETIYTGGKEAITASGMLEMCNFYVLYENEVYSRDNGSFELRTCSIYWSLRGGGENQPIFT
jgi:hypothetical protein